MTHHAASQRHILSALRDSYESRGFTFVEHPGRDLLPAGLADERPDAIAIHGAEKHAIEIRTGASKIGRLSALAAAVNSADGWTLRVVSPGEFGEDEVVSGPVNLDFDAKLREIATLIDGRHTEAALLFAWGVFEAAALGRLSSRYGVDPCDRRTPRSLIALLETQGEISSQDARTLADINRSRNALAHGDHQTPPTAEQVRWLADSIARLAQEDA